MMSGGNDGRVKLWDIKTGRLIRYFTQPAKTIWKLQFTDTRAVVVMQRRRNSNPEEGRTAMEIHDFDIGDVPELSSNINCIETDEDAIMQSSS
jgi:F-box and WD-40 domain protein CDC4